MLFQIIYLNRKIRRENGNASKNPLKKNNENEDFKNCEFSLLNINGKETLLIDCISKMIPTAPFTPVGVTMSQCPIRILDCRLNSRIPLFHLRLLV